MILSNGTVLSSPKEVHDAAVDYFNNFLTESHMEPLPDLSEFIGETVSFDEGDQLCKAPTEDEKDMMKAACDFLGGSPLPRFYSSSYIVLIPKVENPQGFDKFQPISLCSVAYKIFSKILVKRMVHGGNVVVKVDMAKAYDRVDWRFLLHVTQKEIRRWMHRSFSHPRGAPLVSHLLYVDDIVVFANGSKRSMKALMDTFQLYEKWTGQVINKEKLAIFFAKHCGTIHKQEVLRLSSFREGSFPIIYLGVPVVVGRLTAHHLHFLVEKVQKKIASWKMQLLSQGGRLVLLRHGEFNERTRKKWFSWEKIFKPLMEGGHGIPKYVKKGLVDVGKLDHVGSRFWKFVVDCFPDVVANSQWKIREGKISFWLGQLVGTNMATNIIEKIGGQKPGRDILIWRPNAHGIFSTSSAWDVIRIRSSTVKRAKWVWHNTLPKRALVVIWKAMSGSLTVDERIRQVGVAMVSRCNCCTTGHDEDANHVLSSREFVDEVWRKLSSKLGVRWREKQAWWDRINFWWARAKRSSQLRCLLGLIPCLVTWRLWIQRCRARMEEVYELVEDVVSSINFWL
ncbi:uncharacterized protein LOC111387334 [Olea europaea var. sylvestris]|uniref:uncharacterized protein LOC111387334 n=1 Tax=Olea europaea var. sylvestris TaxID=158386 RepID=UPI000C1D11BA|nr:uncharacterized protein LOC111387334 [Olea europaea var. sylvestris]